MLYSRLNTLDVHDRELVALATAKNNLESFIYDMRDKLEHDKDYKKALSSDEQTKITDQLTEMDTWLWDDGVTADVKVISIDRSRIHPGRLSFSIRIDIEIKIR